MSKHFLILKKKDNNELFKRQGLAKTHGGNN